MIALVKRDGDQALDLLAGASTALADPGVPICDDRVGDGSHPFLGRQPGMQQPEAGDLRDMRGELIQPEDGGEDPRNGIGLGGDGRRGGCEGLLHGVQRVCHGLVAPSLSMDTAQMVEMIATDEVRTGDPGGGASRGSRRACRRPERRRGAGPGRSRAA